MEDKRTVEISVEEYDLLLERVALLDSLEAAGVHNWEGYGYALELGGYSELEEDDDYV